MSYHRKSMGWFHPGPIVPTPGPRAEGVPTESVTLPLPPPQPAYGTAPPGTVTTQVQPGGATGVMTPGQAKTFLGINVGILGLVAVGGVAAWWITRK